MPFSPFQRIFAVEDEPKIASTLVAILRLQGYSARLFTSSLEALAASRLKSSDLLTPDGGMPGISGIDLAIRITGRFPACKILLFSGAPSSLEIIASARAQGHDFDFLINLSRRNSFTR